MPRRRRSYLPGAVFHLTARTQGRVPWFTEPLRPRVVEIIACALRPTDAVLYAYAVMPNHLHLVLRQGQWGLGRVMQPLLARVARLVHGSHGTAGHVFEGRFRDTPCFEPNHVRNAIVYTHLNPVRAGLGATVGDYGWTSHALYMGQPGRSVSARRVVASDDGLALFTPVDRMAIGEPRDGYVDWVEWRLACDRHDARVAGNGPVEGSPPKPLPEPPSIQLSGTAWSRSFAPILRSAGPGAGVDPAGFAGALRTELDEIARAVLLDAPNVELEDVRSNRKNRGLVRLRRVMIRRMSSGGHRGCAIARYLRISDQTVSDVLAKARAG